MAQADFARTGDTSGDTGSSSRIYCQNTEATPTDGSIDEMRGPVTVISDGTNTQYIARVSDQNNNFAWYRTNEKGDPPQGAGGIPASRLPTTRKKLSQKSKLRWLAVTCASSATRG